MAKKQKQGYYIHKKDSENGRQAYGRKCVYCGKILVSAKAPYYAQAHTRAFPVCSQECKAQTEAYVARDKKKKIFFYISLMVCALLILAGALFGEKPWLVYPGMMIGGLGMILFPYPISSFETFLGTPIKRVTLITRIIGAVVTAAGLFFLIAMMR